MNQYHRSFRLTSEPALPATAGTPESPTLISSGRTHLHKRVFPWIWFGFLAVWSCAFLATVLGQKKPVLEIAPFLLVPLALAAFGYVLMRLVLFDLVDEVWDAGDSLIVKNRDQADGIPLSNVMNVSYSGFQNPPRVTLLLRTPSAFGSEIAFMPPFRFFPFTMPAIARDLIRRIDATRGERSSDEDASQGNA